MRCFIALPLTDETKSALVQIQNTLPGGRIVPEDNLHVTLCFLADLPSELHEDVDAVLQGLRAPPVTLRFGAWAQLASSELGLLALAVDGGPQLFDLQAQLERRLRGVGVDLPRRRFSPHVTLARPSRTQPIDPAKLAAFLMSFGPAKVPDSFITEIGLYRSRLGSGAAIYELLTQYPLRP